MRNAYPEFRFIYLMYQKGDSILFFADSEPATSGDYSAPGDVYSGAPTELTNVFSGHWQQLTVAFTDEWGDWLSAFVPIKDKTNGKIVAVLGIDRSLALIKQAVSFDRLKIIFIITLLMILLVFFYVYNEIQQKAFKRMLESKNKLRTSEEKLSTLISHLHAGVVVHDRDTRIILSNEQASVLLGFPADQLQGKTANDPDFKFISDDGAPLPLDQYPVNMVIADHMPVRNYVMGVVHRPDKTRVWLLVNAFPEFDNQRLARIVITLSDITELKQAEEALIDSENLNRLVIENQGEGIGIVDRNEIFTFANPAADQMFGLPVGGLVGKNLLDFIVPGYFLFYPMIIFVVPILSTGRTLLFGMPGAVTGRGAVKFSQDLESRYFLTGSFGTAPDSETPTSTSRPGCPPGKNRLLRSQVSAVPSPNRIPTGRSRNSLSSTRLPRAVVPVLAVRMPRITAAAGTVASR
jgi:PAS domain S-box-containing protein